MATTYDDERNFLRRMSGKVLAELGDVSDGYIRRLASEGKFSAVGKRGRASVYNAFEVFVALREASAATMTPMRETELAIRQEQLRRQRLENDLRAGNLVPVDDVHEFQNQVAGFYVRSLESARKKIGAVVDHDTRAKLNRMIFEIRNDLADRLEKFQADVAAGEVERPEPKSTRRRGR